MHLLMNVILEQFIVQEVPYTNLVMLVVYTTCPCETTSIKLEPKEVKQNETQRCQRMKQNICGRRPTVCLNYHPQETDMNNECGSCSVIKAFSISKLLLVTAFFFTTSCYNPISEQQKNSIYVSCLVPKRLRSMYCLPHRPRQCCLISILYVSVPTRLKTPRQKIAAENVWIFF
ncbi:hypothetical protein CEXT_249491 [Caerostris extrusa]|uniref:Uncharacterized protein n=1 Tax=Caerostris extrusa TaxID=172846 RepID=A0AAV4MWD9_CAEEX|nr:hypothetical protein CEXT_249491 [Caerostris extrusa]